MFRVLVEVVVGAEAADGRAGSGWRVTRHDMNVGYSISSTIAAMSTMLHQAVRKGSNQGLCHNVAPQMSSKV
jgi:hypothetical protein